MILENLAFAVLQDESSQPEHMEGWKLLTLGKFQNISLNAGHMDWRPMNQGNANSFSTCSKI
jgi:hypothetical protein